MMKSPWVRCARNVDGSPDPFSSHTPGSKFTGGIYPRRRVGRPSYEPPLLCEDLFTTVRSHPSADKSRPLPIRQPRYRAHQWSSVAAIVHVTCPRQRGDVLVRRA